MSLGFFFDWSLFVVVSFNVVFMVTNRFFVTKFLIVVMTCLITSVVGVLGVVAFETLLKASLLVLWSTSLILVKESVQCFAAVSLFPDMVFV